MALGARVAPGRDSEKAMEVVMQEGASCYQSRKLLMEGLITYMARIHR